MSPYEPPRTISVEEYLRLMGVAPAAQPRRADLVSTPNAMNKTESRYALYLEALKQAREIDEYKFQPLNLRLADRTFLQMDFVVRERGDRHRLVDVKAHRGNNKPLVKDDAQVKIKIAAKEFRELFPGWTFQQAWYTKSGWQHKDFVSRY